MKAFVIWQPWASLVMIGAKPNEFRGESFLNRTSYRTGPQVGERIVLQSAARPMKFREVHDLAKRIDAGDERTGLVVGLVRPLLQRWMDALAQRRQPLPLACGLGTVEMGTPVLACDLFKMNVQDSDRGQFNWAWPMLNVRVWDEPIPNRGLQNFFAWQHQVPA